MLQGKIFSLIVLTFGMANAQVVVVHKALPGPKTVQEFRVKPGPLKTHEAIEFTELPVGWDRCQLNTSQSQFILSAELKCMPMKDGKTALGVGCTATKFEPRQVRSLRIYGDKGAVAHYFELRCAWQFD
jgi:hypothetical protein